ncbi:MAG: hypothetical protein CMN77_19130 [Spirochaetaceae bacterium]|nr:hypothetical protein [Spirochaetaceae bacterium]
MAFSANQILGAEKESRFTFFTEYPRGQDSGLHIFLKKVGITLHSLGRVYNEGLREVSSILSARGPAYRSKQPSLADLTDARPSWTRKSAGLQAAE